MNVKTTRQLLLTCTVILTVLVSLARVTPVLADETIPPQTEPAPAESPAAPQPPDPAEAAPTDAGPTGEAPPAEPPADPADAVPSGEAPPAEEPPADPTEPPAAEEPTPPQEELAQIVETLDQNDIVLVDGQGEPVPLASEEAAEVLQGGSDPWYVAADGSVIGYSATGVCAAVVTTCNTSSTPLAAAIAAAPAGSTIVIDGTYAEQVTINKNLTLQGATTGGTLRLPSNTATNPDTPNLTQTGTINGDAAYALVRVTNNAVVNFENLTIENRVLDGTVITNPFTNTSDAYLVGIWFDNGRGVVNNCTIQEFTDTNRTNQTGVGIFVDDYSE